ncbi:MAG: hypothetical protein ACE5GS_04520 [Kiloniellaceae bacterium]
MDSWLEGEPALDDLLSDPVIEMVLRRDRLTPEDVRLAVEQARRAMHPPAARSGEAA